MLGLVYRWVKNSRSEDGSYESNGNQDREQENSSGLRCRHLAFVEENVHRLDLPLILPCAAERGIRAVENFLRSFNGDCRV